MISRACLAFYFMLYFNTLVPAIATYRTGDTLYVWAVSGLSLRQSPDLNAAKLDNVPYGTTLVAQNDKYSFSECEVRVEAVPGHKNVNGVHPPVMLKGCFVQVEFSGKKGYVFDGYLSKLPAMRVNSCKRGPYSDWKCAEDFETYSARVFGLKAEKMWLEDTIVRYGSLKRVYGNGIIVDHWFDKGEECRIVLPDISMEEGFLIFNNMFEYEQEIRRPTFEVPLLWTFSVTKDQLSRIVRLHFSDSYACDASIRWLPEERMVILVWACSC